MNWSNYYWEKTLTVSRNATAAVTMHLLLAFMLVVWCSNSAFFRMICLMYCKGCSSCGFVARVRLSVRIAQALFGTAIECRICRSWLKSFCFECNQYASHFASPRFAEKQNVCESAWMRRWIWNWRFIDDNLAFNTDQAICFKRIILTNY